MKYAFMFRYKLEHRIVRMARVLGVSESGYYKWQARQKSETVSKREEENRVLAKEIKKRFVESQGVFGIRKITPKLTSPSGKRVNHKRVERLMREMGIFSRTRKTYAPCTDSNHQQPVAPHLLDRDFKADAPREKLLSDTTVMKTGQGKFYIAAILDLFGRYPMGLAMSLKNDSDLVIAAFKDMLLRHSDFTGCIIHSDRGSTYASKDYQLLLKENGLICSMSRKGNCWDNAPMESFFGKLKTEWLDRKYDTIAEAMKDVHEYFRVFYEKKRPHASNKYMTPYEYYYQEHPLEGN